MSPLRIRFAVALLAAAIARLPAEPLRAQQETGADDFRISYMGGSGDIDFRASTPAMAYNATDNEYLVIWAGDTNTSGHIDNRYQVFGQRIDATTGTLVGGELALSESPFTVAFIPSFAPSVAWDGTHNQYLVVWSGFTGICCEIDYELFARRISAAGAGIGAAGQISSMVGPPESPNEAHYDAFDSAVVYNPTADEFLVVWSGDDGRNGLINEEFEIRGQRIDAATGAQVGADDFRISDAGGTGNAFSGAYLPAVAYNSVAQEYLVTWGGEDLDAGTADGEFEIYGQRLDGATAAELGTNDFRISTIGPPGNTDWFGIDSAVDFDPVHEEYLVAFSATEHAESIGFRAFDIFAQRLDGSGSEIGVNDFRISDVGETGDSAYDADSPKVAYSATLGRYLVSFLADDNIGGQVDGELEVFVQAVDGATGAEVGPNDLRVSDMGPNGASPYQAFAPVLAADQVGGLLVAWMGDDNTGGLVDTEFEIFGQLLFGGPLFADGFESAGTGAWSFSSP